MNSHPPSPLPSSHLLDSAYQFYRSGQLPACQRLAEQALAYPIQQTAAQVLLIRCLLEQGDFAAAATICLLQQPTKTANPDQENDRTIWCAALQIFLAADPTPVIVACQTILNQPLSTVSSCTALAQDWLSRALTVQVEWGLAPLTQLANARHGMTQAVAAYAALGDNDAALAAQIRLGKLYRSTLQPDKTSTQAILEQALAQAIATGSIVCQAEALLCLAEITFANLLADSATKPDGQLDLHLEQQALSLYEQANHPLGQADVLLSLGRRLCQAGFDGATALQQALSIYQQQDNFTGQSSVVTVLGMWHLQQGRLADALTCHEQALKLAQRMNFRMAEATASMGLGDYYFRTGDYARALAYYEHTTTLAGLPALQALVGLNQANAYLFLHQYTRAETVCRATITALEQMGIMDRLSLACFILGNILSKRGDWAAALAIWHQGLNIDITRSDHRSRAEKLQSIAQATVMQHRHSRQSSIPAAAYAEAMSLFAQAIQWLHMIGDSTAQAAIADVYQTQGQIAIVARQYNDAEHWLVQARQIYANLKIGMQTAITDTMLGLLCHELGSHGYPDLFTEAERHYRSALAYYEQSHMRDMAWKVCFYLAHTAFRRGLLVLTGEAQTQTWRAAAQWLEQAAAAIEFVRGSVMEPTATSSDHARISLVIDKEKVYDFAVRLNYNHLQAPRSALEWLERLKSRPFLDLLARTHLHSPASLDIDLLDQERKLLTDLLHSQSQMQIVETNDRLCALWEQMSLSPAASEYVALRRGEAVSWSAMLLCLSTHE